MWPVIVRNLVWTVAKTVATRSAAKALNTHNKERSKTERVRAWRQLRKLELARINELRALLTRRKPQMSWSMRRAFKQHLQESESLASGEERFYPVARTRHGVGGSAAASRGASGLLAGILAPGEMGRSAERAVAQDAKNRQRIQWLDRRLDRVHRRSRRGRRDVFDRILEGFKAWQVELSRARGACR